MANFQADFTLFLLTCLLAIRLVKTQPELATNSGPVRGLTEEAHGVNVSVFLGIPYARPPVGRYRFRAPEPVEPWTDTLNATEFGAICAQLPTVISRLDGRIAHTTMDEDCLTLNVYAPDDASNLAVIVFVHGGVFTYGTTLVFDGTTLAALHDVVVVTVNYRLGALGFLSTMDEYSRGNYGLLDQQMAFRWVKDNIAAFGGDPEKITASGRSAGSVSVGFQMLSPSNEGLFQRAICISGVPSSRMLIEKPVSWARQLGVALNCTDVYDSRKLISCLRTKPWQEIIDNNPSIASADVYGRQFQPVVDGHFIPMKPELLVDSSLNFTGYDYLLGFNTFEGKFTYTVPNFRNYMTDLAGDPGMTRAAFVELVSDVLISYGDDDLNLMHGAVVNHYTDWSDPSSDLSRLKNFLRLAGEMFFIAPTIEVARKHANCKSANDDSTTFLFEFSHDNGGNPAYPDWLGVGATHGDEKPYFFGEPLVQQSSYSDEERNLSRNVMKYLTNFVKTGNPNNGETVEVDWPEYTVDTQEYLNFDLEVTVSDHAKASTMALWLDYLPELRATTCPAMPTNCIDSIGGDLGLSLTPGQVTQLINAFIIVTIILLVIVALLCGVIAAYYMKVKAINKRRLYKTN